MIATETIQSVAAMSICNKRERARGYMKKTNNDRVEVKVLTIGVDDATLLRKTCHFPLQRQISDLNVRRLGFEMEKGRFVQGTPVFFCVLPEGTQYVVNGNHTLEAVAYSGKPQALTFIFLMVADFAEAAAVYASFDVHKARTWNDALRATGRDVEMPNAGRVAAAVKIIMSDFKYSPGNIEAYSSRASRFELMDDYKETACLLFDAISGAPKTNSRIITRASVLAVALETVLYQPRAGVEFWSAVARDDGLSANDPRKALLRWLMNNKAAQGAATYTMTRACAHAWNTWRKGQSLQIVRPSTSGKFILDGTPWTGRQRDSDEPKPETERPKDAPSSVLTEIFNTGVRITQTGSEEVVTYRHREGVVE